MGLGTRRLPAGVPQALEAAPKTGPGIAPSEGRPRRENGGSPVASALYRIPVRACKPAPASGPPVQRPARSGDPTRPCSGERGRVGISSCAQAGHRAVCKSWCAVERPLRRRWTRIGRAAITRFNAFIEGYCREKGRVLIDLDPVLLPATYADVTKNFFDHHPPISWRSRWARRSRPSSPRMSCRCCAGRTGQPPNAALRPRILAPPACPRRAGSTRSGGGPGLAPELRLGGVVIVDNLSSR